MIYLFITVLITFTVYSFSITRGWQHFDEWNTYIEEGFFPIATSFGELVEIIIRFAFNNHIESQNAMFSNIVNIRSNTLGSILNMVIMFVFKKNAVYYHLLQIFLHLTSTVFVWFIFYEFLNFTNKDNSKLLFTSLFTLIWSVHPAISETVLLVTNWTGLLTYLMCLSLCFYLVKKSTSGNFSNSRKELFSISALFMFSVLISEYCFTLPFIMFFISLFFSVKKSSSLRESFKNSFSITFPLFIGLGVFITYYSVKSLLTIQNNLLTMQQNSFSLERILWFSPQIFLHYFKLFFFPKELSIYQTNLVHISESLYSFYPILSFFIFISFLILPSVLFFKTKENIFVLFYTFPFSLLPFLHIISPTYCLAADRYTYFPFILIVLLFLNLFSCKSLTLKKMLCGFFIVIILALSTRTIIRINDWKNSETLYLSTIKHTNNFYQRGIAYSILGYHYKSIDNSSYMEKAMLESIRNFKLAIKEFELIKKENGKIKTLILYGLNRESKILKAAYRMSSIALYEFRENPSQVLNFYKPFIEGDLNIAGSNALVLYSKLFELTGDINKAEEILLYTRSRYPYSPSVFYELINLYLNEQNLAKAESIINEGITLYPNYKKMLRKKIALCELKNEKGALARYLYILGLLTHSEEDFQNALQIYLGFKDYTKSKIIINKLKKLNPENPVTNLLISKFYLFSGDNNKAIESLNKAYVNGKEWYLKNKLSSQHYEIILLSLLSFSLNDKDLDTAKRFINELEELPELSSKGEDYLAQTKKNLSI